MSDDRARVMILADIERPDRILGPLTARQLALLTPVALALWLAYTATRDVIPAAIFAALALPVAGAAAAAALTNRDGVSLDQLLLYAIRQNHQPRRLVTAPEGIPTLPAAFAALADTSPPRRHPPQPPQSPPAPLRLPIGAIRPDGAIDMGGEGVAVLVACSTISFALRTPDERAALVHAFGQWLNSITGPTQILTHARPINLTPTLTALRGRAGGLPDPKLEQAALDHAAFLADLSTSRDLLTRHVLIVIREPASASSPTRKGPNRGGDVDGAAQRARRRAEHTVRALAAAGISAHLLDSAHTTAALAAATEPTAPPMAATTAAPGQIITQETNR